MADTATFQFSLATAPGGFLVDLIPFCTPFALLSFVFPDILSVRHIPLWFPGAGFHRKAHEWAATLREMVDRPHDFVKQNMVCSASVN
jgi:hypothetical protein